MGCLFLLLALAPLSHAAQLSQVEQKWLAANPHIVFAPAPNYPPVEFFDESGAYRGITADFVDHITETLGIQFDVVQLANWDQVIKQTRQGKVHMWGAAAQTRDRQAYMNFTRPYIRLPAVIIVRREIKGELTMPQLVGKRVVVIENYATQRYVQENYPDLQLITVPDIETGLRMVSFGIADAIVATNASAIYYIEKNGLTNLRVAGESGYEWQLRFAASRAMPELISILQKGLDSISEEKKREIYRRWISLEAPAWKPSRELIVLMVALFSALLIAAILLWNRLLRRRVAHKTRELEDELVARGELERELRRLATTDELTGVKNRRHWLALAKGELSRNLRYDGSLSMAMIDVDRFKRLNDTYGHAVGDRVLRGLTDIFRRELRVNDILGRIGGEEFVVVLPETNEEMAHAVLERLRIAVEQWHCKIDGGEVRASVSIGFSMVDEQVTSMEEILRRCDLAMYEAKGQGRNRVVNYRIIADRRPPAADRVSVLRSLH
ncbi:MAG: diguanylate cyclase [Candidatus Sedimenticola endophacoides]